VSALWTLPNIVAALMVASLTAYVLFAGADFGGGVWDALATGERRERQRDLISHALAPIWEANHVWLILVIVILFTCFPKAFAQLAITLHIPLSLMLVGIVLRGSAFTFRSYDVPRTGARRRWGRIFAIASIITPVLLGVCVGAISAARITSADMLAPRPADCSRISDPAVQRIWLEQPPPVHPLSFAEHFVVPWLGVFPMVVGLMTLALFAQLAAVYLTIEAHGDRALQDDFRRRALVATAVMIALAVVARVLAAAFAPSMHAAMSTTRLALLTQLLAVLASAATIWALLRRRFRKARIAVGAQACFIVWGWPLAQFPYLVPPRLTIADAAAPARTLVLVLIALAAGALFLFPSLAYLFRIFKSRDAMATAAADARTEEH
jgi:cytochrome d ubiquinol oxidase subunit II